MMKKLTLLALGLCLPLMLLNCKGKGAESSSESEKSKGNVLGVTVPKTPKFVRVVVDGDAEVFRYADPESPWLVMWSEDEESDMIDIQERWSNEDVPDGYVCEEKMAYCGQVLAVLGEEGDFWKVGIRSQYCEMEAGYVKKSDVESAEHTPITPEMVEMQNDIDCPPTVLRTEGQYKGLVMEMYANELWVEETMRIGVLDDGVIVQPSRMVIYMTMEENAKELNCTFDAEENCFKMQYPKSMAKLTEDGYPLCFDPAKLTDAQIGQMLKVLSQKKSEWILTQYFIASPGGDRLTVWTKNK